MAKCLIVLKACKTASERQDYSFNLTREFSRRWEKNTPFDDNIRPDALPGTGFEYSPGSGGGVSNGAAEPPWPEELAGTVVDGSIEWTAVEMSNDGLRHRIVSVDWTDPADIATSDPVEVDEPALQEARVWVEPGGTVGRTYTFVGLVTTDQDAVFEVRLELEIE